MADEQNTIGQGEVIPQGAELRPMNQTSQSEALAPGAGETTPQSTGQGETQGEAIPQGAELRPINDRKSRPFTMAELGQGALHLAEGVIPGFLQTAGETLHGVAKPLAVAADYYAPGSVDLEKGEAAYKIAQDALHGQGDARQVGEFGGRVAENVLEYIWGSGELKSLKASEKMELALNLTRTMEKHPFLGKLFSLGATALHNGTVGTAQSLVHGSTLPDALRDGAIAAGTATAIHAVAPHSVSGKPGTIRPGTTNIAGVDVPVSAPQAAKPSLVTKAATIGATPEGAQKMISEVTQPAAVKATIATLSDTAVESANPLRAIRGEAPLDPQVVKPTIATVDDAAQLVKTEAQKTYKPLDEASQKARDVWEADNQDWQDKKPLKPTFTGNAAEKQASKEAFQGEMKTWNDDYKAWTEDNPQPKTFSELQTQIRHAKRLASTTSETVSMVAKQEAIDALPDLQREAAQFSKKYGVAVSEGELRAANQTYAKYSDLQDISDRLKTAIKGTTGSASTLKQTPMNVNVNILAGTEGWFDKAHKAGEFAKLLGNDGYMNWNNIINALKNPISPTATTFLATVLRLVKAPASVIVNRLLFDPEFGKAMLTAWKAANVAGPAAATAITRSATHRYDPVTGKVVPNE